jgi:hypothetical protein
VVQISKMLVGFSPRICNDEFEAFMKRASVSEVIRLKPTGSVIVPHKLQLSGNMENRDNVEAGALWGTVVKNGLTDEAIK